MAAGGAAGGAVVEEHLRFFIGLLMFLCEYNEDSGERWIYRHKGEYRAVLSCGLCLCFAPITSSILPKDHFQQAPDISTSGVAHPPHTCAGEGYKRWREMVVSELRRELRKAVYLGGEGDRI